MSLEVSRVRELLAPFDLDLTLDQFHRVIGYLDLLLRWNPKINLTGIRIPEECVQRHFAESLYLTRWIKPPSSLLDVGSGAGFPGLALKIMWETVPVALLEPVAKKRAFLKEVARVCGFSGVDIRPERLEDIAKQARPPGFAAVTMRAVGGIDKLVPHAARCLAPGGHLCLWAGRGQAQEILGARAQGLSWLPPIPLPVSKSRQIWIGGRFEGDIL